MIEIVLLLLSLHIYLWYMREVYFYRVPECDYEFKTDQKLIAR